jgi:hypothetical protein
VRYKIVIFDGGVEEIVIWAASVDVGGLNDTSNHQLIFILVSEWYFKEKIVV